jgi:hypothetical protein
LAVAIRFMATSPIKFSFSSSTTATDAIYALDIHVFYTQEP